VANLDTEKARLEKQGVEVWGVRSTSNGWTIGYLRDPEGNILELIQR
jgi:predicted enzyme related to lactoylglutathione lyase